MSSIQAQGQGMGAGGTAGAPLGPALRPSCPCDAAHSPVSTAGAPNIVHLTEPLVEATIRVYATITSQLLPTPAKSHYTFNLRDLSKVFQGMLMAEPAKVEVRICQAQPPCPSCPCRPPQTHPNFKTFLPK